MNLLGGLNFVDSIQDFASNPSLNGATDIAFHSIGSRNFVYVSGFNDNGIQVLEIAADGTLSPVSSFFDTTPFGLRGPVELETVTVNGNTYLIVLGRSDQAIVSLRIDPDGEGTVGDLSHVESYFNFPGTGQPTDVAGLLSSPGFIDAVEINGRTFVAATSFSADTVSIFEVNSDGTMSFASSVSDADGADLNLSGAWGVEFHQFGSQTYVFVNSFNADNGWSIFSVSDSGQLSETTNLDLVSPRTLTDIEVMEFNGTTYMFTITTSSSRIIVYEVEADGSATFVSETPNFINGQFSDLQRLHPLEIAGVPYLMVTTGTSDTVLIMSLDENRDLQVSQMITDATELNDAQSVRSIQLGERVFLVATAAVNDSVAVFEIGAEADAIVGTMAQDRIVGLDGDDDLLGRAGNDELIGGRGDDVLSGHRGADRLFGNAGEDVLIGGDGNDVLNGGGFGDFLNGGRGIDVLSYTGSGAAVNINLNAGTARGGHANGDIFINFENVTGSGRNETITGDNSANVLIGGNGNDRLVGLNGNDVLRGGNNNDTLQGGGGADRINGDGGADLMFGGGGNDRLFGNFGNDVLNGNAGNDFLSGGSGIDTIDGGTGDDTMTGGAGADTFLFTGAIGNDTINGFQVDVDVIDFSAIANISSFADFQAAALTLNGSTLIIVDGGDNTITITDVEEGELDANDFIFV